MLQYWRIAPASTAELGAGTQLLYGEAGHEVAVRSELHRLREILGPALATCPYRLEGVQTELPGSDA